MAYSEETAQFICRQIAEGKSRKEAAALACISVKEINNWLEKHDEFALRYARAKEELAEHFAEEIILIADAAKGMESNAEVNAARLRVDSRKWVAAHLLPRRWGDRLIHAGDDDSPVNLRVLTDEELLARAQTLLGRMGARTDNAGAGAAREG